jgi:hypothetical protein
VSTELRRFFDRAIRASFHDLSLDGDPVSGYLADLLTRFARTESLHPRGVATPRLEAVVDMLLDIQAAWQDATPRFDPSREVTVRRHIGDYALFMTGVFRERVERVAGVRYYVEQGRRAYQFVSEHARASGASDASSYRRLAERFERYAGALDYARRVHFAEGGPHPFFRLTWD